MKIIRLVAFFTAGDHMSDEEAVSIVKNSHSRLYAGSGVIKAQQCHVAVSPTVLPADKEAVMAQWVRKGVRHGQSSSEVTGEPEKG